MVATQTLTDWVWPGPHWSNHTNGKNYLAKLERDTNSHTGLQRHWQPRAKGKGFGFVWRQMAAGDAFEIGSHDVDATGTLVAKRTYGVVIAVDAHALEWIVTDTASSALQQSEENISVQPADNNSFAMLQRRARDVREQIQKLTAELNLIRDQIKEMGTETGLPENLATEMVADTMPEIPVIPVVPVITEGLQDKAKRMIAPPPPSQDDDDEDELTPAQLAALQK